MLTVMSSPTRCVAVNEIEVWPIADGHAPGHPSIEMHPRFFSRQGLFDRYTWAGYRQNAASGREQELPGEPSSAVLILKHRVDSRRTRGRRGRASGIVDVISELIRDAGEDVFASLCLYVTCCVVGDRSRAQDFPNAVGNNERDWTRGWRRIARKWGHRFVSNNCNDLADAVPKSDP